MTQSVAAGATVPQDAPITMAHVGVLFLGLGVMVMEGYDTYSVGFVGPQLAALWHLAMGRIGVVLTAGVIGSAIGYVAIGPVSDRFGRRRLVILATAAVGICSLLTVTAGGPQSFVAWRILTGLALGAALPNVVAMMVEHAPAQHRSLAVVILYSGFGIGAALGAALAAKLIPVYGWQAIFVLGGVVPLAWSALMLAQLPDVPVQRSDVARSPVAALFSSGRLVATLSIWTVLAMNGALIACLNLWLTTHFAQSGVALAASLRFSTVMLIAGILGAYVIGSMMDRFGTYAVLIPTQALAAAMIALTALTLHEPVLWVAVGLGAFLNGGTSGAQGLLAALYPTFMRATGIGWASSVGRLLGIAAPLALSGLLAAGWSARASMLACVLPAALGVVALFTLRRTVAYQPGLCR